MEPLPVRRQSSISGSPVNKTDQVPALMSTKCLWCTSPGSPTFPWSEPYTWLPALSGPTGRRTQTLVPSLVAGHSLPWIALNSTVCNLCTHCLSKERIQSFLSHPLAIFFPSLTEPTESQGTKKFPPPSAASRFPQIRWTFPNNPSPKPSILVLYPWKTRPGVAIILCREHEDLSVWTLEWDPSLVGHWEDHLGPKPGWHTEQVILPKEKFPYWQVVMMMMTPPTSKSCMRCSHSFKGPCGLRAGVRGILTWKLGAAATVKREWTL